jgi:hypothetical protein
VSSLMARRWPGIAEVAFQLAYVTILLGNSRPPLFRPAMSEHYSDSTRKFHKSKLHDKSRLPEINRNKMFRTFESLFLISSLN